MAGFVDETQNSVCKFSRNKLRKGNTIHSDKIDYVMVTSLSCQVFVDHYQKLLNSENYVTRRQSLKVGGASSMCQSFQYFSLFMHIKTIDSSVWSLSDSTTSILLSNYLKVFLNFSLIIHAATGGVVTGPTQFHNHESLHQQPGQPEADDEDAYWSQQKYTVWGVPRVQGGYDIRIVANCLLSRRRSVLLYKLCNSRTSCVTHAPFCNGYYIWYGYEGNSV